MAMTPAAKARFIYSAHQQHHFIENIFDRRCLFCNAGSSHFTTARWTAAHQLPIRPAASVTDICCTMDVLCEFCEMVIPSCDAGTMPILPELAHRLMIICRDSPGCMLRTHVRFHASDFNVNCLLCTSGTTLMRSDHLQSHSRDHNS